MTWSCSQHHQKLDDEMTSIPPVVGSHVAKGKKLITKDFHFSYMILCMLA
jgi:hypothetical protein